MPVWRSGLVKLNACDLPLEGAKYKQCREFVRGQTQHFSRKNFYNVKAKCKLYNLKELL